MLFVALHIAENSAARREFYCVGGWVVVLIAMAAISQATLLLHQEILRFRVPAGNRAIPTIVTMTQC